MRGTVTMYMVPYSSLPIGGIPFTPLSAGDQGRHRITVSHHENSAAGMFAENAPRQGARIVAGYD